MKSKWKQVERNQCLKWIEADNDFNNRFIIIVHIFKNIENWTTYDMIKHSSNLRLLMVNIQL